MNRQVAFWTLLAIAACGSQRPAPPPSFVDGGVDAGAGLDSGLDSGVSPDAGPTHVEFFAAAIDAGLPCVAIDAGYCSPGNWFCLKSPPPRVLTCADDIDPARPGLQVPVDVLSLAGRGFPGQGIWGSALVYAYPDRTEAAELATFATDAYGRFTLRSGDLSMRVGSDFRPCEGTFKIEVAPDGGC